MAKRRGRPPKKKASNIDDAVQDEAASDKNEPLHAQEVERQVTAIRALRDVGIEKLRTMLHLLRSYVSKEQLQVPNEKDGKYEVHWKDDEGRLHMDQADGGCMHASLLHRLSMVYQDFSTAIPSFGGFEFSNRTVKTNLLGVDALQINGLDLEEPYNAHVFGLQDKFQTPGATSQRMSIGMTPKTLRLPKPGEMLLSFHGSPLGIYKEDNMEVINGTDFFY
ncbi:hypothetical protein M9H77_28545 [Catharanthus roseus]|uniref:Uncharacterized protein n=1 Tax=Catharanthus roseus TaxID=4058 RepID=A0ACC0AH22_CATRO|nr:hypothetical protein M9H77_28545 [Catharanthus roseus]